MILIDFNAGNILGLNIVRGDAVFATEHVHAFNVEFIDRHTVILHASTFGHFDPRHLPKHVTYASVG